MWPEGILLIWESLLKENPKPKESALTGEVLSTFFVFGGTAWVQRDESYNFIRILDNGV